MSDEYEDKEPFPSDDDLLETFWEESYPGAPSGLYALEPKEVYTDHGNGIKAVREQLEPHLRRKHRQELLDELTADTYGPSFNPIELQCDTGSFGSYEYLGRLSDWLKSHGEAE